MWHRSQAAWVQVPVLLCGGGLGLGSWPQNLQFLGMWNWTNESGCSRQLLEGLA